MARGRSGNVLATAVAVALGALVSGCAPVVGVEYPEPAVPPAGSGAPAASVEALGTGLGGELLALGYGTLRASLDGWHWRIVAEPSDEVAYDDVAPFRDGYVVVGATTPAAGDPARSRTC